MATTTNNGWTIPAATDYVKDGYAAIDTLGNAIDTSTGKGLIAWQSWAPTLSSGWLNGNGTWSAKYAQLGKIVMIRASFTVGSTTTKGTGITFSLPVTAAATSLGSIVRLNGTSTNYGFTYINSTTTAQVYVSNAAGTYLAASGITSTVPFTWATGDSFDFQMSYEAA